MVSHCTFFDNAGHGIAFDLEALSSHDCRFLHNIFRSNGGYGIYVYDASWDFYATMIDYNHYSNNTSGAVFWKDSTGYSEGNINGNGFGDNNTSGDPKFTSEVNNSEDLTPLHDSPLIGGGYNHLNIGAIGHGLDYPAEEDVESGVDYANGELTGTLAAGSGVSKSRIIGGV
jgi:hypothetical protein